MEVLNSTLLQMLVFSVAVITLCELCIRKLIPFSESSGAREIDDSNIGEERAKAANKSITNTRNNIRATYAIFLISIALYLSISPLKIV